MKTKLGFIWSEYRGTGSGYRHGSLTLYELELVDLRSELFESARQGGSYGSDKWRAVIQAVGNVPVYRIGERPIDITWQTDVESSRWYAARLLLTCGETYCGKPCVALQRKVVKVAESLSYDSSPFAWVKALGAVPIVRVDVEQRLHVYDLYTLGDLDNVGQSIYGPAGKPADKVGASCAA